MLVGYAVFKWEHSNASFISILTGIRMHMKSCFVIIIRHHEIPIDSDVPYRSKRKTMAQLMNTLRIFA